MCDTDNATHGSMLSKSATAIAVHLLPIQEGGDANAADSSASLTNLMPVISPLSNSIDAMQMTSTQHQQHSTPLPIVLDDIANENYWLREKMKEITADRDRLLCEVANLRLELDMAELKRIPEDRFVSCDTIFMCFMYFIEKQ